MNSTVRIHRWMALVHLMMYKKHIIPNQTHWSCGTIPILSGVTERGVFGEIGLG